MTVLVAAGVACGLLAAWVFRRTADMAALRATLRQIHARFLEIRLYFDEPRLIWRAQKALIGANLRVCALMLRPALILALPMAWLTMQLDAVYGAAPLRAGEPAVVTAQLSTELRPEDAQSVLQAPAGIAVETPPVRIAAERQIAWRIRPLGPVSGRLRFTLRGATFTKAVAADSRSAFPLRRRERPLFAFLMHPEEPRLPAGSAVWLEVDYPEAARWWIAWFVGISTAAALVFARWLEKPIRYRGASN
jgi:hypothetical protein